MTLTCLISLNPRNNPGTWDYSHFCHEKTEGQRDQINPLRAHNWQCDSTRTGPKSFSSEQMIPELLVSLTHILVHEDGKITGEGKNRGLATRFYSA